MVFDVVEIFLRIDSLSLGTRVTVLFWLEMYGLLGYTTAVLIRKAAVCILSF